MLELYAQTDGSELDYQGLPNFAILEVRSTCTIDREIIDNN